MPVPVVRPEVERASQPTRMLAAGGREPMLAAHGARVVIGFSSGADAVVHTSRDGGATFPTGAGLGATMGEA